ncbi:MAG: ABC transporter substrate-binding protein [Candidatus Rokubacteria bacterium]|nr:ABC transporter substrate-binding protein [Candidatus Rokubacteria bacterium]
MSGARVPRRAFLQALATGTAGLLAPRRARAEEAYAIGLVLPAGAGASPLEQGTALGLGDANALLTMFGKRLHLETATAENGPAAAAAGQRLLRGAGAIALVGGAGDGVADALRDVAAAEGGLLMNVAATDDRLRHERCEGRTFHLIPSTTMYVDALAQWLIERRALRLWAIAGDPGPVSREIEAAARRAVTARGGTLVPTDAGPEVLLLALEGAALREAAARARAGAPGVTVAGVGAATPEGLGADEAAGVWAVGWHAELERFSARELNARFRRRFGTLLTETGWAAWAAVKLVGEAVVRGSATDAAGVRAFFESAPPFDGHKGTPLTFRRWDHQLRQPLYILAPRKREEVGGRRGPFAVLADLPGANLDALGTLAAQTRCPLGREIR